MNFLEEIFLQSSPLNNNVGSKTFVLFSIPNLSTISTPDSSLKEILSYLFKRRLVSFTSSDSNLLFPKLAAYDIFLADSGANAR